MPQHRRTAASQAPQAAAPVPPRRAARQPACVRADQAKVNHYLAAYLMGVANRLANGASSYYRKNFNLGMSEWRTMMAIGSRAGLIVREVAEQADIDYAAASKSLRVLQERGLVDIEQTQTRGRAAKAVLTAQGRLLYRRLQTAARQRQKRLIAAFDDEEVATLWALLRKVEAQVPAMNAD
jgi:DNA-binding MarR family transcriptional regulator